MRLVLLIVLATAVALGSALPALAHNPSEKAVAACIAAVDRQLARGVEAGGGPKEGIPGPSNCDHFFFLIGAIGNENSGGP